MENQGTGSQGLENQGAESQGTENQEKAEEAQSYNYKGFGHPAGGRVLGGLVIVAVGVALLLEKTGYSMPAWLFTWKSLLIVIGIYIGARHLFRGIFWLIPVLVGSAFLAGDFIPGFNIENYVWPIVILFIGLSMILRPGGRFRNHYWRGHDWRHHDWKHQGKAAQFRFQHRMRHRHHFRGQGWENWAPEDRSPGGATSGQDRLDEVYVFSGTKKTIISKEFRGGEMTCVFGGAELDLSQADINGKVYLELNMVFGGAKLVIPPHWQVQTSDIVAFMGGVEDKRPGTDLPDSTKVLILSGNSVFGGIVISSH